MENQLFSDQNQVFANAANFAALGGVAAGVTGGGVSVTGGVGGNDNTAYAMLNGTIPAFGIEYSGSTLYGSSPDPDYVPRATNPATLNGSLGTSPWTMLGGPFGDSMIGGSGNDTFLGDELPTVGTQAATGFTGGNDTVLGGAGQDSILGQGGNDSLLGEAGNDIISGGNDNDTLLGGDNDDSLLGGNGNDSLLGGDNNDTLLGGNDNDTLLGGNNEDSLLGDNGNDSLLGEGGNDTLLGGSGNDTLLGGSGNDSLLGEAGNDTLQGFGSLTDVDTLTGGSDNDTFVLGSTGGANGYTGTTPPVSPGVIPNLTSGAYITDYTAASSASGDTIQLSNLGLAGAWTIIGSPTAWTLRNGGVDRYVIDADSTGSETFVQIGLAGGNTIGVIRNIDNTSLSSLVDSNSITNGRWTFV